MAYDQLQSAEKAAAAAGFVLGVQIVNIVNGMAPEPTAEQQRAIVAEVQRKANGDTTYLPSAAEMRQQYPTLADLDAIRQENEATYNAIAAALLERWEHNGQTLPPPKT